RRPCSPARSILTRAATGTRAIPRGGLALHDHARGPRLQATGIARVPVVDLVSILLAGEHGLLGVHNDNVVAHVDVRRIGRLVLALEARGNDRRQAADYEAFGVDQDPLLLDRK